MIQPVFSVRRFGQGYRRAEVDAFVDRLLATANRQHQQPVTRAEVRAQRFGTTLTGGYAVDEVDQFLTEAEAWLPAGPAESAGPGPAAYGQPPRPTFNTVRLREGYDPQEVDAFVTQLFATLEGRASLTPAEVRTSSFTPVRAREGYDMAEVDAFLDLAESWLHQR